MKYPFPERADREGIRKVVTKLAPQRSDESLADFNFRVRSQVNRLKQGKEVLIMREGVKQTFTERAPKSVAAERGHFRRRLSR